MVRKCDQCNATIKGKARVLRMFKINGESGFISWYFCSPTHKALFEREEIKSRIIGMP